MSGGGEGPRPTCKEIPMLTLHDIGLSDHTLDTLPRLLQQQA